MKAFKSFSTGIFILQLGEFHGLIVKVLGVNVPGSTSALGSGMVRDCAATWRRVLLMLPVIQGEISARGCAHTVQEHTGSNCSGVHLLLLFAFSCFLNRSFSIY